ncbi:hypothetical protein GOP47_0008247 [Adiantum capillus-veneris]|uniref:Uncharacterized protein n=1 Tax=Adiantum capillus-veneris TaxID=13818 RepID=A0A9D4UZC9_ADICA|nr:hypothetical protein GOP47_0008247 [Adiantum capillus-veneris]
MVSSRKWFKVILSRKKLDEISADKKPNRWKLWKSFNFIGRKFSHSEREAGKKKGLGGVGKNGMVQQERAAIRIQTAFRVFLAKKALRALKGLLRLQAAITGHDTPKQSSVSLHCIHVFVRVQARIHRQRAGKSGDALGLPEQDAPSLVVDKCRAEPEMEWCNALGTVEEIQAKEQQRQMAAIKRERAIAYAFCNKWKANTKINPGSLFDYELDNSTWVWIWLDEWLNGQTKKPALRGDNKPQNDGARKTTSLTDRTAITHIQKCKSSKVSAENLNGHKVVHTRIGSPSRFRLARSLSSGKGRKSKAMSPKRNHGVQPKKSSVKSKQHHSKDAKPRVL